MNAGRAIQGMDYAMRSGIMAAETVVKAKGEGDFGNSTLKKYQEALDESYVMKDIRNFQDAVELLHDPAMRESIPNLICDFGRNFFQIRNEPTRKARHLFSQSVRRHSSWRTDDAPCVLVHSVSERSCVICSASPTLDVVGLVSRCPHGSMQQECV